MVLAASLSLKVANFPFSAVSHFAVAVYGIVRYQARLLMPSSKRLHCGRISSCPHTLMLPQESWQARTCLRVFEPAPRLSTEWML